MRPDVQAKDLADLAIRFPVTLAGGSALITGVTHDSRAVRAGDLYAALPGNVTHGARFAEQAVTLGAVAILTDADGAAILAKLALPVPVAVAQDPRLILGPVSSWVYDNPSRNLTVVAITGTDGKTTTAMLTMAALQSCGVAVGLMGTVGNRYGALTFPGSRTTPEAPELQAMLAVMAERGAQAVVMEVSSHALALHRVDGVAVDVAVFTNLSHDHLDFHGDMETYFQTKAALFTDSFSDHAVICIDDEWGQRLAAGAEIPTQTYGLHSPGADWQASAIRRTAAGSGFVLTGPGIETDAGCRIPGDFNVANSLAAVAVAHQLGYGVESAIRGVSQNGGVPGRMQLVHTLHPTTDIAVFVDYAHTPDAVQRTLSVSREIAAERQGRVLVAIGCGGDRDRHKRSEMGAVAAQLADVVVVTDDNPRSEDPAQIRATVLAGARQEAAQNGSEVVEIADRAQALRYLISCAHDNDVVLALGKGHETMQEVAGKFLPFHDADVLSRALRGDDK